MLNSIEIKYDHMKLKHKENMDGWTGKQLVQILY